MHALAMSLPIRRRANSENVGVIMLPRKPAGEGIVHARTAAGRLAVDGDQMPMPDPQTAMPRSA